MDKAHGQTKERITLTLKTIWREQKRSTYFATLLQSELNSEGARFTH